jgi:anaerobic magnesium-protoporphyrin IX monomethyl ester cyclase
LKSLDYKKILLIHPLGYNSGYARKDISRMANLMPPIGLASISSYLEIRNIESVIIDCFAKPESDKNIKAFLIDNKPAFIGITCTTSSFYDGVRIAGTAKKFFLTLKLYLEAHMFQL